MPFDTCPNLFPKLPPGQQRLAVIGEAPGTEEMVIGEPFVGTAGRLLRAVLGSNNIADRQIFFGNICQHNPPRNELSNWDWYDSRIQSGIEQLVRDLHVFRPNCLLLLGRATFRAVRPDLCYEGDKGFSIPLSDWRGSIIAGHGQFAPFKCVPTYHPAYILRAYGDMPYFRFDVGRGVRQSSFVGINPRISTGVIRPTLQDVLLFIARTRQEKLPVTFDIEGYCDDVGITMLSLVWNNDPCGGIVIPFWIDGRNYWTSDEEVEVWQALAGLLADADIPKTAHQSFYELFVFAWRHRCIVNNLHDDTLMERWELFPELERSLAVCTSMHTEIPFYKDQRLSEVSDIKLQYNLTDSQATALVKKDLDNQLARIPRSYEHYRFNINLIPAYNYIMLRGCRLDLDKVREHHTITRSEIAALTSTIDSQILEPAILAGIVTRKRKSDPYHFNVDSGKQLRWLLYTHLQLKPLARYKTNSGLDSTSEDVLLHHWTKSENPLLRTIIQCIRKRTRLSDIEKLVPDPDGRIRSSYDPVGTDTGRLSSRKSQSLIFDGKEWVNTGTNLQNVTKELRGCFVTDNPEYDFFQFDLSGADGWTVAADLAALGHPAMLEDYLYGIKPALVLYYMLQEQSAGRNPALVNRLDRAQLKLELKRVKNEIDALEGKLDSSGRPADWQYLCCKRVQHGSNYGAMPTKIAEVIFGDSDGTIVLSPREADRYQYLYKLRYNTDARNEAIRRRLMDTGYLVAACGIRRQFFAIRNRRDIDDAVIRAASSFEPQANTTWATNKALERLWYDCENRTSRGSLFIEPLLQIHDALAGQFRSRDREWAGRKIHEWFQNPLIIAGTKLTIPVDGKWGPNWKECKHSF